MLKRKWIYGSLVVLIILAAIVIIWLNFSYHPTTKTPLERQPNASQQQTKSTEPTKPKATEKKPTYIYSQPTKGFKNRVTKKPFGIYVSPGHSPVSPERFTGYHTGADAEYGKTGDEDIPVSAITAGKVIAAEYVDGYGGAVAVRSKINGKERVVIYGHLDPNRLPSVGRQLSRGEQFAYLGKGYSHQTDGERKQLHLGILKGDSLNWKGYVQHKSQLSGWLDPMKVLNET